MASYKPPSLTVLFPKPLWFLAVIVCEPSNLTLFLSVRGRILLCCKIRIKHSFELLCHARFLLKMDLCNAYHLIRAKEGDEWKTLFWDTFNIWWCFGLTNALVLFQALIKDTLLDMLNHFVFVYIYSHTLQEQTQLSSILHRIWRLTLLDWQGGGEWTKQLLRWVVQ